MKIRAICFLKFRQFIKTEQDDIMFEMHGLMMSKHRRRDQTIQDTSISFGCPSPLQNFLFTIIII